MAQLLVLALAASLLLTGFTGHAGVQLLDGALLAKLERIHRHGVPGEAEYIAQHGSWEGYVHGHCHREHRAAGSQPSPDQVQAAASLAGAVVCAQSVAGPFALPTAWHAVSATEAVAPTGPSSPPLVPPPR